MVAKVQFEILGKEPNLSWRLRDSDGTIRAVPSQKFETMDELEDEIHAVQDTNRKTKTVRLDPSVVTKETANQALIDAFVRLNASLTAGVAITPGDLAGLAAQVKALNAA